jgi:hypothetical protein
MNSRWRVTGLFSLFSALFLIMVCAAPLRAAEESNEALAKAAQNPVANLISVPFQNNINFNVGR